MACQWLHGNGFPWQSESTWTIGCSAWLQPPPPQHNLTIFSPLQWCISHMTQSRAMSTLWTETTPSCGARCPAMWGTTWLLWAGRTARAGRSMPAPPLVIPPHANEYIMHRLQSQNLISASLKLHVKGTCGNCEPVWSPPPFSGFFPRGVQEVQSLPVSAYIQSDKNLPPGPPNPFPHTVNL